MTKQSEQFIPVHTVANRFEADLIMDAFRQEGIPALLQSFEETAYDGLFIPQRGWGRIMVPEELAPQARELIQPLIGNAQAEARYRDLAEVDPLLWERLEQGNPDSICRNAQVRYDREASAYVIPFLNCEYRCFPTQRIIEVLRSVPYYEPYFEFYLVVLNYLLEAQPKGISGQLVSEKDLPGGTLFFQGPHQFPTAPLLRLFGTRLDIFQAAAEKLEGTQVDAGDMAFRFWSLPNVPLLYILWAGDEEFEPALRIRFDATIILHLGKLDVIWALVNVVSRHLRAAAEIALEERKG